MIRKIVSTTLLVSLIAIASSGIMMIVIDSFEFQLRMHPVHKIFGIIMTVAGILHVYYNFNSIKNYLDSKKVVLFGIIMTAFMILLYFVGFNKSIDKKIIKDIEISTSMLKK